MCFLTLAICLSATMVYLLSPSSTFCASNNDFVFFVSVSQINRNFSPLVAMFPCRLIIIDAFFACVSYRNRNFLNENDKRTVPCKGISFFKGIARTRIVRSKGEITPKNASSYGKHGPKPKAIQPACRVQVVWYQSTSWCEISECSGKTLYTSERTLMGV